MDPQNKSSPFSSPYFGTNVSKPTDTSWLKKLKKRTHAPDQDKTNKDTEITGLGHVTHTSHDSHTTPSSSSNRPVAAPRRKKLSNPSNNLSKVTEDSSPVPSARPRPSSFHGEDSLKLYEIVQPPIPKPRKNPPGKSIKKQDEPVLKTSHSTFNGPLDSAPTERRCVYSKGSKEYKAQITGTSGDTFTKPSQIHVEPSFVSKVPFQRHSGIGLCRDDDSSGPRSIIPMLDLAEMSLVRNYEKSRYHEVEETDNNIEPIDSVEVLGLFQKNNDDFPHIPPVSTVDKTKKTPPDKPPRSRDKDRRTSVPIKPCSPSSPPGISLFDDDPSFPRSQSYAGSLEEISKQKKTKSKWKLSPFLGRKQKSSSIFETSDVTVDKMEDEESVISQKGTINPLLSPLHRAKTTKKIHELLKNPDIDVNERDDNWNTPIHYFVKRQRSERHYLLLTLLQSGRGVDVNALDSDDNTALHIAAEKEDSSYAAILLAFDADAYIRNRQGKYPIDITSIGGKVYNRLRQFPKPPDNEPLILSSLPQDTESVDLQDLMNERIGRLLQPDRISALVRKIDSEVKKLEQGDPEDIETAFSSLRNRTDSEVDQFEALNHQGIYLKRWKTTAGSRVLFLDGGGIRGLVQIEILMELERRTGRKITELFDWIVGTSTGGIVALGLVYAGKSLEQMRQIYFKIKSDVFMASGLGTFMNMSQKSKNLEKILKNELGDAPLSSKQHPRVMICTVNREQIPLKVVFFNNFMTNNPHLTDVPLWKAARATSAAPMYFTQFEGKYVDGGVKANNPCEFAMNEINRYDQSMGLPERHFALAVSIGTGIFPEKTLGKGSEFSKANLMKQLQYVREMVDMLTEAVSESQMAAEKFAMMCRKWRYPIPFFRFSPQLQDVISPGETDDQILVAMMLQAKQYLIEQETHEKFNDLVKIFKRLSEQSMHV